MRVCRTIAEVREARGGIEHLGQVAHAYIEADGGLAVYRHKQDDRPGLPIVPPWDIEPPRQIRAGDTATDAGPFACMKCGTITDAAPNRCPHCGHDVWTPAQTHKRFAEAGGG